MPAKQNRRPLGAALSIMGSYVMDSVFSVERAESGGKPVARPGAGAVCVVGSILKQTTGGC